MKWIAVIGKWRKLDKCWCFDSYIALDDKNDPCNTYFLVGSPDLIEKATEKLDMER